MQIRILLVDDDRRTLRAYGLAIQRKLGFPRGVGNGSQNPLSDVEVLEADTTKIALAKLADERPDLILVDLRITGTGGEEMGGLEIINRSLELDRLRPVIVVTGYGTVELARQTMKRGIFDFIEKSEKAVGQIVDAIEKAVAAKEESFVRAGNPFTMMSGSGPNYFGGRSNELEFLTQRIDRVQRAGQCEHFLVLGDWGIGKTSLFREFKKVAQARGHHACVVPLQPLKAETTLVDAARALVEGVLRDLPCSIERLKNLTDWFETLGISVLGSGLQISKAKSDSTLSAQAFLHDALLKIWEDIKTDRGVVLILLDDLENYFVIPEILQTIQQTLMMDSIKRTRLLIGMATQGKNWARVAAIERHHPLSRFFVRRIELPPLTSIEVRETVFSSLTGTGIAFDNEIIERIFVYSQGHPFEMQAICYHLFNQQIQRRVTVDAWGPALRLAVEDLGATTFHFWLSQATELERYLLTNVARKESAISLKEIRAAVIDYPDDVEPSEVEGAVRSLCERGLLRRAGVGQFAVRDEMFRMLILSVV